MLSYWRYCRWILGNHNPLANSDPMGEDFGFDAIHFGHWTCRNDSNIQRRYIAGKLSAAKR
jgi:hypothetical protein